MSTPRQMNSESELSSLVFSRTFEKGVLPEIRQEQAQLGHVLMARDAELLQQAACGEQGAILRFYEWIRPTVSLGFHQAEDILDREAVKREGIPWVRRPTGGAAVLHSQELTYSLVLPSGHPLQREGSTLEHVGNALVRGLRALGVPAQLAQRSHPLENLPNRTSCFIRASRWEVCVRGRKIVGSAQRLLNGALLQHGSILCGPGHLHLASLLRLPSQEVRRELLARLRATATSVTEELGSALDMCELRNKMAEAFTEEFASLSGTRELQLANA
ncbi:MAG: lipoate--protein ligase family protein [bacterium]